MEFFSVEVGGWQQGILSKVVDGDGFCLVRTYSGDVRVRSTQLRKASGFAHPLQLHQPVAEQGMHAAINIRDASGRTMISYAEELRSALEGLLDRAGAEPEPLRTRRAREALQPPPEEQRTESPKDAHDGRSDNGPQLGEKEIEIAVVVDDKVRAKETQDRVGSGRFGDRLETRRSSP